MTFFIYTINIFNIDIEIVRPVRYGFIQEIF